MRYTEGHYKKDLQTSPSAFHGTPDVRRPPRTSDARTTVCTARTAPTGPIARVGPTRREAEGVEEEPSYYSVYKLNIVRPPTKREA